MNEFRLDPDTDELPVDVGTSERSFTRPARRSDSAFVSHAGVRLAKFLGLFLALALVVGVVWGTTRLIGGGTPSTVAEADWNTGGADSSVSSPEPGAWADAPATGDSALTEAHLSATEATSLTNGDMAYCSEGGKVVHVGATRTYRGTVCDLNGELVYYGLNKSNDGRITLPSRIEDGTVVAEGNDGYTYTMTENSLEIRQNGNTVAEEETLYWWPRGHSELTSPGDLEINRPITYPSCDGTIAVIAGSAFDPATDATRVQDLLNEHPGAEYLRTDLSCDNFHGPSVDNSDGNYIYAVYYSISASEEEQACSLTEKIDGYADWMRDGVDPHGRIECG